MKQLFIIIFIILVSVGVYALTMEEWIDAGGAKRDPYGNKCLDYCNNGLYACREKVDTRYSSRDQYVNGLAECNTAYNKCVETCVRLCK